MEWTRLPDPGGQSMMSDWRIVKEPLGKSSCNRCGLTCRTGATPDPSLYGPGYSLYAHAPGEPRERARQEAYATWIAGMIGAAPARVLDVGCGNGSLLLALRGHWPRAEMLGCDLSPESLASGAGHDLRLWRGSEADLPTGIAADVVVSVNVVEHTADPLAFVQGLRRALADDGLAVLVHPDGATPGLELLFADHLFSFSPAHIEVLLGRAGFRVVAAGEAPASIGAFRIVVARAGGHDAGSPASSGPGIDDRRAYLTRWQQLDSRLQRRMRSPAVCFGASEAAGLLRAYAPGAWSAVEACTVDGAMEGRFGELPIVALDAVDAASTVLVGVRPRDQPLVAARLRPRFANIVTWYDLVDDA